MLHFYILDTETTGLKAGYNEIFQISVLRHSDGFQITKNIAVENPRRASQDALRITGKTIHDIQQGIPKKQACEEIINFIEEDGVQPESRCIIAHNWSFDKRFCHAEFLSVQKKFPANLWLCTMAFTKKFAKHEGLEKIAQTQGLPKAKFGLDNCLKALGITAIAGAHSASIDVQNTKNVFNSLMDKQIGYLPLVHTEPHIIAPSGYDFPEY